MQTRETTKEIALGAYLGREQLDSNVGVTVGKEMAGFERAVLGRCSGQPMLGEGCKRVPSNEQELAGVVGHEYFVVRPAHEAERQDSVARVAGVEISEGPEAHHLVCGASRPIPSGSSR